MCRKHRDLVIEPREDLCVAGAAIGGYRIEKDSLLLGFLTGQHAMQNSEISAHCFLKRKVGRISALHRLSLALYPSKSFGCSISFIPLLAQGVHLVGCLATPLRSRTRNLPHGSKKGQQALSHEVSFLVCFSVVIAGPAFLDLQIERVGATSLGPTTPIPVMKTGRFPLR